MCLCKLFLHFPEYVDLKVSIFRESRCLLAAGEVIGKSKLLLFCQYFSYFFDRTSKIPVVNNLGGNWEISGGTQCSTEVIFFGVGGCDLISKK